MFFRVTTENVTVSPVEEKSTATTIPFFKNNEYAELLAWTGEDMSGLGFFYPGSYFIITAVSNGANLTDGIDGLAAGTSAISVLALGILRSSQEILFSQLFKYNVYP
jgi:phospho-N-acetylmuramoyl-pentapeptide-transferase